jgi:hypothetical protein
VVVSARALSTLSCPKKRKNLTQKIKTSKALWLDGGKARALVLWRPLAGWADAVAAWARDAGMAGQVVTVDELATEEAKGTGEFFVFFFLASLDGEGGRKEKKKGPHSTTSRLSPPQNTNTHQNWRACPGSSSWRSSSSWRGGASPSAFVFVFFIGTVWV